MKTLIVLVLLLLATATATGFAAYGSMDLAEVTSAVSHASLAEPAQLLMCGSALLMLSVAVRRLAASH
jgi:hypothetical protein